MTSYEQNSVTQIVFWYDRNTRSWIIQLKDTDGNQIGEAEYYGNRNDLIHGLWRLESEHMLSAKMI